MGEMKNRMPGVLLYFRDWRTLEALDPERFKAVFIAVIDYAEHRSEPHNLDQIGDMAFRLIRPRIDEDIERYEERRSQAQYAANVRWGNASACEGISANTDACGNMPDMPIPKPSPLSFPYSQSTDNSLSKPLS